MKRLLALIISLLWIPTAIALAVATYTADIYVANNTSVSYPMLGVISTSNNTLLAANHFITASGLDSRVQQSGGDIPWMLSDTRTLFGTPVPATSTNTYQFVTGQTAASKFDLITGYGGYVTIANNVTQPSANFSQSVSGYLDTSGTGEDIILLKPQAEKIVTVGGNITVGIDYNVNALDFEATNTDNVSIPDSNAFSFTDGSGNDTAFSITGWVRPEANAGTLAVIDKQNTVTTSEWTLYVDTSNNLTMSLRDPTIANYITESSNTVLVDGTWRHFAFTYSGSETHAGMKWYMDGVETTTTDTDFGVYAGMTDGTSPVVIGSTLGSSFLDGTLSNLKIYSTNLTGAEVLNDFYGITKRANLVAWYKLTDGAGNPIDSTGNGHDATTNLADWITTGGKYLGASEINFAQASGEHDLNVRETGSPYFLRYGGNDYTTNNTANFRAADSSGAIEVWFRSSSVANFQTIFASSDTGTQTSYIILFVYQTNGRLTFQQQNAAGALDNLQGTTNVSDGNWHHIVVSSSGTAYTILLDGVAQTLTILNGANSGDWFADTTLRDNLTTGAWTSTGTASYAIGDIGFTRIYSRQMLAAEALTNYQAGRTASASDTTGLVFNLPTSEGTGNPVDTVGALTMTRSGVGLPTWTTDPNLFLYIDGVNSANTTDTSGVPNTAYGWTLLSDTVPYADNLTMYVGGNREVYFAPNAIIQGTDLVDRESTGGLNDGVITWGANPTGVSTSFGSLTSTQVITSNETSGDYLGSFVPADVNQLPSPTLVQANAAVISDPFYNFWLPFANLVGLDVVWFYWIATIIVALVLFVLIYKTKHLTLAAIGFDLPFGYGIVVGYVPWYGIIFLVIWTIGAAVQEARMG